MKEQGILTTSGVLNAPVVIHPDKGWVSAIKDIVQKKKEVRKSVKSIFPYGDSYNEHVKTFYRWVE